MFRASRTGPEGGAQAEVELQGVGAKDAEARHEEEDEALMPNPVRQFNNFTKLIAANTTRFNQPQNTLPRIVNLLGTVRGGLVTCDGTRIISSPNGNATPVPSYGWSLVAVSQVVPLATSTEINIPVGLMFDGVNTYKVVNLSTDPWTTVGTFTGEEGEWPPQIVQTMSGVIFATGHTNPVMQWSGEAGAPLEQVTNLFNVGGVSGIWTANTNYGAGTLIVPSIGNLTSVAGSPFASASTPTSIVIDPVNHLAYVAAANGIDGYSYVTSTGVMSSVAGSPFSVTSNQLAIDTTNHLLFSVEVISGTPNVFSCTYNAISGAVTQTSSYLAPYLPEVLAIDTINHIVFVVSNPASPGNSEIQSLSYNTSTGALTFLSYVTYAGTANGIVVDTTNRLAFVSNGNLVEVYSYNPSTGVMTVVSGSPFSGPAGLNTMALDSTNHYLYAASSSGIAGWSYNSSTGAMMALSGSPYSANIDFTAIAVDATNGFVFSGFDSGIVSYTYQVSLGVLNQVGTVSAGTSGGIISIGLDTAHTIVFGSNYSTSPNIYDYIYNTSSTGHYYMAQPGGLSGGSLPAFPSTIGSQVSDGTSGLIWTNMGSVTAPPPPGAMHASYHLGSVWLWGVGDDPADLNNQTGSAAYWISDLQDLMSYNPLNQGFIGLSDGQHSSGLAEMSIAEFGISPTAALVVFKQYSTYQVIGAPGAADFAITEAQTNLGCVAPRTISFMSGVGIIRMSHLGVAVFDGMRDRIISEEIRPYLFPEWSEPDITPVDWNNIGRSIATFTVNPPMYMIGLPTVGTNGFINRFFVYDLILQAWTIVDFPFFISSVAQIYPADSLEGQPITVLGSADDGTLRRWQVGDSGWDTETVPISWSFRTPEVFTDPNTLSYFRWMQMRVKTLAGQVVSPTGVSVADGIGIVPTSLSFQFSATKSSEGQYNLSHYGRALYQPGTTDGMATFGIHRLAYSGYMDVYGSGQAEIQAFHFETKPMPTGTLGRPM